MTFVLSSIRNKLLALFLVPFVGGAVFASVYFPMQERALGMEAAEQEVSLLSEMLAFSVGAGLNDGNFELVQTAFDWAKDNPNVAYIAILDETGEPLIEHNPDDLQVDHAEALAQDGMIQQDGQLQVDAPVVYSGTRYGDVVFVYSTAALFSRITKDIATALIVMVLGVLASIFVVYHAANVIARSIVNLRDAAQRVGEGDLDADITVDSQDEVGDLAVSFQKMVADIRTAQTATQAEKAAVEQKVEEAVEASEAERAYLTERVDEMLGAMERFADGDLTVHLEAEREDVIARLYTGFNRAVDAVRGALLQLEQAVEQTSAGATDIQSATTQLTGAAQEQSAQANEIAASVEEMTRTIIENAQNASGTAEKAAAARDQATESSAIVQDTVGRIRRIAEVVQTSAEAVERLGQSSRQIGQIVETINEIADQTNLLALNAAIEAARAGEQGRGFAVVADEVRKLAERTAGATDEIARMIQSVQQETDEAVTAIRGGQSEVEDGLALADQAGASMQKIVSYSEDALDMTAHVASASEQQSATSEQIASSIASITAVSSEAAADTSRIASSIEQLTGLTAELRELVTRFDLHGDGRRAKPTGAPHTLTAGGDGWAG